MPKANLPLLSIVIPAYNSKTHYKILLESLLKIKYSNYEIVVIDDGSKDGSFELMREMAKKNKKIRVIKTLSRKGIPGSRNLGIEVSNGDLIAFFDTDMEVKNTWPGRLIEVLERGDIGAVLPKVIDFNERKKIQAIGFTIDPHSAMVIPKAYGEKDFENNGKVEEIGTGAAGSIIKREVLEKLGGFDESLGMFDDIDLGWRIRLAGWKTVCVHDSVIYHWTSKPWSVRPKSASLIEQDFYLNNLTRSFIKNYEAKNIVRYLPQRLVIMLVRVIINLLRGNAIPMRGYLESLLWNITNLNKTLEERAKINGYRKVSDSDLFDTLFEKGSLVSIYMNSIKPIILKTKHWNK